VQIQKARDCGVRQAFCIMRAEVCIQRVAGAQLVPIKRRVGKNLADACWQPGDFLEEHGARAPRPWVYHVLVEQHEVEMPVNAAQ
jgi:hypothetical protein